MTAPNEVWRLFFDEDADGRLAAALRRDHVDIQTTAEADRLEAPDDEQLAYAVAVQRVLVTQNVAHFPNLHVAWRAASREHFGIIVLTASQSLGTRLRRMRNLLARRRPSGLRNDLIYLGAEYDD